MRRSAAAQAHVCTLGKQLVPNLPEICAVTLIEHAMLHEAASRSVGGMGGRGLTFSPSRAMSTQKRPSAVSSLFLWETPRVHSTRDTSSCSLLERAAWLTDVRHTRSARAARSLGNCSARLLPGSCTPAHLQHDSRPSLLSSQRSAPSCSHMPERLHLSVSQCAASDLTALLRERW